MGYDLHITRRENHFDEGNDITKQEWDQYVKESDEFELAEQIGDGMYTYAWTGPSKHKEPWLMWYEGCISSKYPDRVLIMRMIEIAKHFDANVQGDDGEQYETEADIAPRWDEDLGL